MRAARRSVSAMLSPYPFSIGGTYPAEWVQTLEKFAALQPAAIIPGHGDGETEDRHFHAAELIVLQSEGQTERDCDGNNSQAVAHDRRLETLKLSIPARQKAPDTGITRWLREVSHSSSSGPLWTGVTAKKSIQIAAGTPVTLCAS